MLHCSNFQWKGFTSLHFIKHLLKVAGLIIPRWEFLSRSAVSNCSENSSAVSWTQGGGTAEGTVLPERGDVAAGR